MSPTSAVFAPVTNTLYVSDTAAGHVVPVAVETRQVGQPIQAGQSPVTCALTPGGDILLVVDTASNDVAAIRTKTLPSGQPGLSPPRPPTALIAVGSHPRDLAIKVF
jgi:DNA-binding beta-propeller fold protein YncE